MKDTETMKKRKEEAMVETGLLGEQQGDGEKQEETRRGGAGHLLLLSTVRFPHPYAYFPSIAHSFLPRSLSFISLLYLSILSLALLPFFSHVRSPPFSALPFLVSIPRAFPPLFFLSLGE